MTVQLYAVRFCRIRLRRNASDRRRHKMKTCKLLTVVLLCLCMGLLAAFSVSAEPAAGANVYMEVDKTTAVIGDTITVTIKNKANTFAGFGCYLDFDKAVLKCTSVVGADGEGGETGFYLKDVNSKPYNTIDVDCDVDEMVNSDGCFSFGVIPAKDIQFQAGTVATLSFEVIKAGDSKLVLTEDSAIVDTSVFKGVADEVGVHVHYDANNTGYCSDKTCKAIIDGKVAFSSSSITLGGELGVNVKMELTDAIINDKNAYMRFTYPDNKKVKEIPISQGIYSSSGGKKYYKFTFNVYATQMADEVEVQVIGTNYKSISRKLSVAAYIKAAMKKSSSFSTEALDMIKAMANYGAAAQIQFATNTENLANASLPEEDRAIPLVSGIDFSNKKIKVTGSVDGLVPVGASTLLDSNTTARIKISLQSGYNINDYTFTVNGKELLPFYNEETNQYYCDVKDISADNLGTMYEFKVVGESGQEMSILYSVYTYVNAVINGSQSSTYPKELKDLARSMYWYGEKTISYVQSLKK